MTDFDHINTQTKKLRAKTERLAQRKDGIYYAVSIIISLVAVAVALFALIKSP